jgi:hypothetical protein
MRRREFIAGLGGAVAWPYVARRRGPGTHWFPCAGRLVVDQDEVER